MTVQHRTGRKDDRDDVSPVHQVGLRRGDLGDDPDSGRIHREHRTARLHERSQGDRGRLDPHGGRLEHDAAESDGPRLRLAGRALPAHHCFAGDGREGVVDGEVEAGGVAQGDEILFELGDIRAIRHARPEVTPGGSRTVEEGDGRAVDLEQRRTALLDRPRRRQHCHRAARHSTEHRGREAVPQRPRQLGRARQGRALHDGGRDRHGGRRCRSRRRPVQHQEAGERTTDDHSGGNDDSPERRA